MRKWREENELTKIVRQEKTRRKHLEDILDKVSKGGKTGYRLSIRKCKMDEKKYGGVSMSAAVGTWCFIQATSTTVYKI